VQLTNRRAARTGLSALFLTSVAGLIAIGNLATLGQSVAHRDSVILVVFLILAAVVLGRASVALDRGRLTLSGLALGPAALLLNPIDATVVGLSLGLTFAARGSSRILTNALLSGAYAGFGAAVATHWFGDADLSIGARLLVLCIMWICSWVLLAASFSFFLGESISSIVRRNFTPSFYAAYGYFTLGSLLISYVLDGSALGYFLAIIVWTLALALTDTIAGRRVRRVLESELSDADRHLFHSRAVEGVVHNLRNHIATAVGYLKEIDTKRLDPVDREAVETAKAAANDAATVLHSLAHGATPRVTYATEPVDLNELVSRALDMARPRARAKHIELGLHETPDIVRVRADPLLLREVATNLVNNAIDAAPTNGKVELGTGRRSNGWPYFSVQDNGPGVADENRHHLFEPHFTTKETGTGLGLFMSYGIVREHQGRLNYEGSRRGAVFTVELPPYSR
jgi:signal transduction histidine kinase